MITKPIDENSVALIPEESDDLFTLRRIIKKGDRLAGDTTRAIKQEKEFSRPDRGERVKIRISLEVEKISIDDVVDRLKAHGTIIESDSESVKKGSHHSLVLRIGEPFTLTKKNWADIERKLIYEKNRCLSRFGRHWCVGNSNSFRSGYRVSGCLQTVERVGHVARVYLSAVNNARLVVNAKHVFWSKWKKIQNKI